MRKLLLITASLLIATGAWSASCPTGLSDNTVAMDLQLGHQGFAYDDFLAIRYCKRSGGKNCLVICRSGKIVSGVSKAKINKALSLGGKKSNLRETQKYTPSRSLKKEMPQGRRTNIDEVEYNLENWESDYPTNKAVALGDGGEGYLCYGYSSLSAAMRCALKGCQARNIPCTIVAENNETVDQDEIMESLEAARKIFYGNNRNSSSSVAQSQSSSSLVDECLKKMAETRNNYFEACRGSYSSTLPRILHYGAAKSACTTEAQQRFPDVACYGVSLPAPSPPIGSTSRQGKNQPNTGWKYVMTLDSAVKLCPIQPEGSTWLVSLDHSEVSGMNRICYYK